MDKNNYPLILEVEHVSEILNVGKKRAYEIMNSQGFPLINIGGRLKRVPRDKFFEWLENQAS